MGLTVLLGGQKSGKSSTAARTATATGLPVVFVAPAEAIDDTEFAERIARHRADRPDDWRTLETYDLVGALDDAGPSTCVIIDALDTWLLKLGEDEGLFPDDDIAPLGDTGREAQDRILDAVRGLAQAARTHNGDVVVVTGQPGLGMIPVGATPRRYADLHGLACRILVDAAHAASLVVAGHRIPLRQHEPAPPRIPASLHEHGDRQVHPGTVDLAVNVLDSPPAGLAAELAEVDWVAYPDDTAARAAIAARHGTAVGGALPLNGAAEAFWLLARTLRPRLTVCIHPSFTAPEAALRSAGATVTRVVRGAGNGWTLDPAAVPADADLVVLGRPDNPTGALDDPEAVASLARPGRTLVVDEAFADFLPDAAGLTGHGIPGLVAVRSLTKLWGLAGLRVGYLIAEPGLVARLEEARQPWPVNAGALRAIEVLAAAEDDRAERAAEVARLRAAAVAALRGIDGLEVWESPANFLLLSSDRTDLRERLLDRGLAARRGDTFPGLDARYLRIAVREPDITERLAAAIREVLHGG